MMTEDNDDGRYYGDCDDDHVCPDCHGEGGWHDCGEDTCCCADPDELTDICQTCGGEGVMA